MYGPDIHLAVAYLISMNYRRHFGNDRIEYRVLAFFARVSVCRIVYRRCALLYFWETFVFSLPLPPPFPLSIFLSSFTLSLSLSPLFRIRGALPVSQLFPAKLSRSLRVAICFDGGGHP